MDITQIMIWLSMQYPVAGTALVVMGFLVVCGQAYVLISPNKKDDAWLAKMESKPIIGHILKTLKSFAPIQKKDKK